MSPKRRAEQQQDVNESSLAERLLKLAEPLLGSEEQPAEREDVIGALEFARAAWNLDATLGKRSARAEDRAVRELLSRSPDGESAELYLIMMMMLGRKNSMFGADRRLIADVKLLEHRPGAAPRIEVTEIGLEEILARVAEKGESESGAKSSSSSAKKRTRAPQPPKQFVVDLRHYATPSGLWREVPPAARKLAQYMGEIAAAASLGASNGPEPCELDVDCRKRTGAKRCKGRVVARTLEANDAIEWSCATCGEWGAISGWRGSAWDHTTRAREWAALPQSERFAPKLRWTDWRTLTQLECLSIASHGVLTSLRAEQDGFHELPLSRTEFEDVCVGLSAEIVECGDRELDEAVYKLEERYFARLGYGHPNIEAARTAAVLAFRARAAPGLMRSVPRAQNPSVHRLSVALEDVEPPVVRQLAVRSDTTLEELHAILQVALGWTESHLHRFDTGDVQYMHERQIGELHAEPSHSVTLLDVLPEPGARLLYEYDFGDDWRHIVRVRSIEPRGANETLPRCEGGQNSAPPEDVGGASGYEEFLQALADPSDERHEELRTWVGGAFDPHAFDLERTNRLLALLGRWLGDAS